MKNHAKEEVIELVSYDIRDIHSPKSVARKMFNSILFTQSSDALSNLLKNESYEFVSDVDINENENRISESIGKIHCPICGSEIDHSEDPITYKDILEEYPEKCFHLMPQVELVDSHDNTKKLTKFSYVRCDKCIHDISKLLEADPNSPLRNPNLENLASRVGNLLGLELVKKYDAKYNLKRIYPTQKFFYIHKNTNRLVFFSIFEVAAHINYLWKTFEKNKAKLYGIEALEATHENLGEMISNDPKNPIISDFLNYLVSGFSQIIGSEDFQAKDLAERFKIIIPETYANNNYISCEGVDFEFKGLSIPLDYNEVVSSIPKIHKMKNEITWENRKKKKEERQAKKEQKMQEPVKTVETSVDKKEPVLDTVQEKPKVEIKHTHEVIDDSLTPEEQKAETERQKRMSSKIWKYWRYLDDQEFLDRYYLTKQARIKLIKKFDTPENRALCNNDSKELVQMAIEWYITEKKKMLEKHYDENPDQDAKELELHNRHVREEAAKQSQILGLNQQKQQKNYQKPTLDSNNSYIDHLHKDQYKPEHTDTSKLEEDRVKRDQANRNKGLNPKIVFNGSNIDSNDPFEDSKTAVSEFNRSDFGKVLSLVMNHEKNKAHATLLDFNRTKFVPIVDFDSGFRLVCIDLDDMNLKPGLLNPIVLSKRIAFTYSKYSTNFQTILLYNTEAAAKRDQVVAALLKLVNYFYYPEHKKLCLSNEFVLLYTTEKREIEEFENLHSILPAGIGKPKTSQIGIVALIDPKNYVSSRYRKKEIADSMTRDYYENSGFNNLNNYRMEMVIAARYIEKFVEFEDPVDGVDGYWTYTITQYTEHKETIMDDGLSCVISGIVREHYAKNRGNIPYKVILEYDRTLLISPIIRKRLELLGYDECPFILSASSANLLPETTRECYKIFIDRSFVIQDPTEKRFFQRVDTRFYDSNETTFRRILGKRIQPNVDCSTSELRKQVLTQLGFSVYYEPELVSYEVKSNFLAELEQSELTQNIIPVSVNDLREANGFTNLELQSKIEYQVGMLNSYKNQQNVQNFEDNGDIWSQIRVFSSNLTGVAQTMNKMFGGF